MTHKLANLAKRMGYTITTVNIFDGSSFIRVKKDRRYSVYDPANNLGQRDELQNEFKIELRWWPKHNIWSAKPHSKNLCGEGKTIGEAITDCAIKVVENKYDE